jgi:hypothetical protein
MQVMLSEEHVNTLRPGDAFRDWLIDIVGERISNRRCSVAVYRISPVSHTVCRYKFEGENYSVVAKFYAEPTAWLRKYDPAQSMQREFDILRGMDKIIDGPGPIAAREDYHCVLVTEHVRGKPLFKFMNSEEGLYDRLTTTAHTLRKLHNRTKSDYRKQDEFAHFHKILDQLRLNSKRRLEFNKLLGSWWYSTLIDQPYGCRIHNDPNPVNLVFNHDKLILLDFESSWEHANFVHDLGIVTAELKHYFARHKGNSQRAEPYIGHFLWHYSQSADEFRRITHALPFFMSLGLLRIARLGFSSRYLIQEALSCLRSKY